LSVGEAAEPAPVPEASNSGKAPLVEALRRCIAERRSDGRKLAVFLIETGLIGRIDAVWGYPLGDAVRDRMAALLRTEVLRPDDIVGEMGRDEIACVLSPVDGSDVALLAAEKCLRGLSAPMWMGDEEIYARPAIGVVMYPEHGDEPDALLQRAKGACLKARRLPTPITLHAPEDANAEASSLLRESRLRAAVGAEAIGILFQPQYDLRAGTIMGVESHMCWGEEPMEIIPAAEAFAAAESGGVVNELITSMLNRALRNCSEFRYSAGLDLRIAVNLPARLLLLAELPDTVERALRTWSLRPGRLMLEIGEIPVLNAEPVAQQALARLKEIGVKLSIDDTAMTLSSLFRLATMPFQEIKIDLSAARDLMGQPKSDRILQSLIELAHQLRLDFAAIGAPDEAAIDRLKELGCDFVQADFKAPPVDPAGFVARYAS
jgi:diguanylate cyclase (GGDEF)-like protein